MATANPSSPPRRRLWLRLLLVVAALLAALLAWYWSALNGYARIGAAYGARVACSCRFEGGRSLGDCRKDFEPGMGAIMLSEDPKEKSVTARFPLLAKETATYHEGEGCLLQPWKE